MDYIGIVVQEVDSDARSSKRSHSQLERVWQAAGRSVNSGKTLQEVVLLPFSLRRHANVGNGGDGRKGQCGTQVVASVPAKPGRVRFCS